jgi:hypothetical protein
MTSDTEDVSLYEIKFSTTSMECKTYVYNFSFFMIYILRCITSRYNLYEINF